MKKFLKIFFSIIFIILIGFLGFFCYEKIGKNPENFDLHIIKNMVKIITKNHNNITSESSGYRISEKIILASAHAVLNAHSIEIDGKKMNILKMDEYSDFVLLGEEKNTEIPENFFKNYDSDEVFAFVMRGGKWEKISGKILEKNIEINALTLSGKIEKIFIKNLTNLDVRTGDSGAPIFGKNYEIIDIVHTDYFPKK